MTKFRTIKDAVPNMNNGLRLNSLVIKNTAKVFAIS